MDRKINFLTKNVSLRDIPIGGYFYKNFLYQRIKDGSHGAFLNNHYGFLNAYNLDTHEIKEFDELTFVTPLKLENEQIYTENYEIDNLDNNDYFTFKKPLRKILLDKQGDIVNAKSTLNSICESILLNNNIYEYITKIELKDSIIIIYVEK